ncbi:MAG TPA: MMPL family transporter [Burkholderiales bacterium]|nr:MMPL family transporter [Burkholderiales bacterium]
MRRSAVGLWLAFVVACAAVALRTDYSADLAAFLPRSPTPAQQILVDELREGVVSRIILVGLEGAEPARLAALSRALAARLAQDPRFAYVANGADDGFEADLDFLHRHRYLLSPAVAPGHFDAPNLHAALERQLGLLDSNAGMLVGRWIENDPTGETLRLLEALGREGGPRKRDGVWFSADGRRALLVAQTRAAGFDIDAQEAAQAALRAAFGAAQAGGATLLMTGPGMFAVQSRESIKRDATRFSLLATVLVSLLMLAVYRRPRILGLMLLPVATGALAGVAAVSLGFGAVHGVTLGFGATLIGEAVDYAMYVFTNTPEGGTPRQTLARIWPTLRLGMLTSVCGFAALLFSGFPGLAQLGLFSIAGLVAAAAMTRWVLPQITPGGTTVRSATWLGPMLQKAVAGAGRLRLPLAAVVAASCAGIAWQGGQPWDDELSSLSPAPLADQQLDAQMRRDLGAPDVGPLIVVREATEQAALESAERIGAALDALRREQGLDSYDSPALLLPSAATQRQRQQAIPAPGALRASLAAAARGTPFRVEALQPFLDEAGAARSASPVTRADLEGTALALKVDALLAHRHGEWFAMLPLKGRIDAEALRATLRGIAGERAVLLEIKKETDALYRGYRTRATTFAVAGVAAIALLLAFSLRSPARVWDVLAPLAAAVVVTVALLLVLQAKLNLFHLVGLLLVVGVGSNYALFFERGSEPEDRADASRIYTSVFLCNLSTVIGFGVLALAATPVLRAIGGTVALGALLSLVFAAILVPRRAA